MLSLSSLEGETWSLEQDRGDSGLAGAELCHTPKCLGQVGPPGPLSLKERESSAGGHLRGCQELTVLDPGFENGHSLEKAARPGASGGVIDVLQQHVMFGDWLQEAAAACGGRRPVSHGHLCFMGRGS